MKVAILVLNYNGKALLSTYLGSVVRHKEEAEVWVVDNGSTDEVTLTAHLRKNRKSG